MNMCLKKLGVSVVCFVVCVVFSGCTAQTPPGSYEKFTRFTWGSGASAWGKSQSQILAGRIPLAPNSVPVQPGPYSVASPASGQQIQYVPVPYPSAPVQQVPVNYMQQNPGMYPATYNQVNAVGNRADQLLRRNDR